MAAVPDVPAPTLEEKAPSSLAFLTDNAITSAINNTYASLAAKREAMGLTNPGTVEGIDREVKREVLLNNYMFSGLRCDLQKIFSVNPLFRLQHGFAMGSQALPPWQMMAIYGTNRVSSSPTGIHPLDILLTSHPGFHARCLRLRWFHHRMG